MDHLAELNFLIDQAKAVAGSDYQVAKLVGVTRMNVSNWRSGKTTCPPERQALLAAIAGFDPQTTLLRATVEKHEGTPLGDQLMRVLGKGLLRTGAALGFAGAGALAIYSKIGDVMQYVSGKNNKHNGTYVKRRQRLKA